MNLAFKEPKTATRSLDALAEALLLPSGIDGVYARTAAFEDVVDSLAAFISRQREPGTEVLRFPPVMSRRQLEMSGYLKSFPHFLGCVCCLDGAEAQIRGTVERFEAGRGLDAGSVGRRSRADAGGLLSGLSAGREPRRGAGRRSHVRCRQRLLPPRAVARPRSAAIVPHARICLRRHARADRRFPPPLDGARAGPRRPIGPAVIASIRRATRSSAAAASSWR